MASPPKTRSVLGPWQRAMVRVLIPGAVALTATGLFLFFSDGAGTSSSISLVVHIFGGALLLLVLLGFALPHMIAQRKRAPSIRATGAMLFVTCLIVVGTGAWPLFEEVASRRTWARTLHVAGGALALILYFVHRRKGRNPLRRNRYVRGLATATLVGMVLFAWDRLNPEGFLAALGQPRVPTDFTNTRLVDNKYVPVEQVDDSAGCVDCHKVIFEEWQRSAHRHASMTNPFYRATIEEMRRKLDLTKTKFCSGCHDPALLFTGEMDSAKLDFEGRAAKVGLSCVACHTIEAEGHRGNADYLFKPRRVYAWERSDDPTLREAHAVLIRLKPEAHKRSVRPPNLHTAEFCSLCHKAELSPELNDWHWFRAQDEYDNWHASGVSMGNSRSFYHPPAAKRCHDCHMPRVSDPDDPTADKDGTVPSHLFSAANTGLPFLRGDHDMIERIRTFLRTACRIDITSVDITRPGAESARKVFPAQVVRPRVQPGDVVEAHVVVRTVGVGHTFPGGTIDSNEVWVEFEGSAGGKPFFVSGAIDPETGIVEQTAEFYRAWVADRKGERVVNRLGTDVYTRVHVKTIPPGAADVVRYRFRVPEGVGGELRLRARLRYRKFMREYVDFVFPKSKIVKYRLPDGSVNEVDVTKLPVIDMAETELVLPVGAPAGGAGTDDAWGEMTYERVNDLGIGYLLQKDYARAEAAFRLVTKRQPDYADGWVNLARVHFMRRRYDAVIQALTEAMRLKPGLPKALYFQGEVQRARQRYEKAEASYKAVLESFPEDRIVLLRLGLVLWEQDRAQEALEVLLRLIDIDEANPQAWFQILNCYKQLGDAEGIERAQKKLRFYRPDDQEWTRTGKLRLKFAHLQRLARRIHVHVQPGLDGE